MSHWFKKNISPLILLLLLVNVGGCGFHLKGLKAASPLNVLPDYSNMSFLFKQSFEQSLYENNLKKKYDNATDVDVTFKKIQWRTQSVSISSTGAVAEYRLHLRLIYQIDKNEKSIEKEITTHRDFKSNNAQLLAVDSEQLLVKRQILQSVSNQIIRSLY